MGEKAIETGIPVAAVLAGSLALHVLAPVAGIAWDLAWAAVGLLDTIIDYDFHSTDYRAIFDPAERIAPPPSARPIVVAATAVGGALPGQVGWMFASVSGAQGLSAVVSWAPR